MESTLLHCARYKLECCFGRLCFLVRLHLQGRTPRSLEHFSLEDYHMVAVFVVSGSYMGRNILSRSVLVDIWTNKYLLWLSLGHDVVYGLLFYWCRSWPCIFRLAMVVCLTASWPTTLLGFASIQFSYLWLISHSRLWWTNSFCSYRTLAGVWPIILYGCPPFVPVKRCWLT